MTIKSISKKEAAAAARAAGDKTFTAVCKHHDMTAFYVSGRDCVQCALARTAKAAECTRNNPEALKVRQDQKKAGRVKRMASPEYREANARATREYTAARILTDPEFVAYKRGTTANSCTVKRMRKYGRPEAALPRKETLAECRAFIARAPEGSQIDHAVPVRGLHPVTGEWVVSGLHVPHNLEPMTAHSNRRKRSHFDPMNPFEFQKPYNSFPGGQFHGDIGEIEFARYTQPTTLELWTQAEFVDAVVAAGAEAMREAA